MFNTEKTNNAEDAQYREMGSNEPSGKKKKGGVKKIVSIIFTIIGILLLVIIFFDSFYSVSETEAAVVTTFGKAELNPNKGIQFKIPFIQEVTLVDTTVQGITIGYDIYDDGSTYSVDSESVMITSDYNFLDLDFYVSY